MKQILLVIIILFSCSTISSAFEIGSQDPIGKSKANISQFHFMIGTWDVSNQLRQHDGTIQTINFIVTSEYTFDGLGIKSHWVEANASSKYVGTVLRTYNPQSEKLITHFFDPSISVWDTTKKSIEFTSDSIISTNTGEDRHGKYKQRTVYTIVSEKEYQRKTERLYEGLDGWLMIDNYSAIRS